MNNETRPVIGVTSPFQMVLPDLTLSPGSESNRLCLVVTSNRCLTLLHLLGLLFFFFASFTAPTCRCLQQRCHMFWFLQRRHFFTFKPATPSATSAARRGQPNQSHFHPS